MLADLAMEKARLPARGRWERDMTQATTHVSVTSQTIAVEHIRIASGRPFAKVRRKLEGTVPKLDKAVVVLRPVRR
jgi:hypothetical protein